MMTLYWSFYTYKFKKSMEKSTSLQRLEALVAGETSTWLQDAESRLANEAWLDRSSEIAIAVLFTIDDRRHRLF